MDPPPIAFQIVDPAVFRSRMTTAGLKDVKIDTITEKLEFKSGSHLWDWLLGSNPLATMMTSGLSKDQAGVVQDALEKIIRQRAAGNGPAVLTNPIHIGVGTK
jgi:hypothetical protein